MALKTRLCLDSLRASRRAIGLSSHRSLSVSAVTYSANAICAHVPIARRFIEHSFTSFSLTHYSSNSHLFLHAVNGRRQCRHLDVGIRWWEYKPYEGFWGGATAEYS